MVHRFREISFFQTVGDFISQLLDLLSLGFVEKEGDVVENFSHLLIQLRNKRIWFHNDYFVIPFYYESIFYEKEFIYVFMHKHFDLHLFQKKQLLHYL